MNDNPQKMPPVPPFVRFVASAVPMVFDNSLSYYEALCALWKYIQSMTDVINNNATLEDEFIEKVNELETYVNTYFDNLDVQTEINNKLDAMVEAGTLADIISQYLDSTAIFGFDTVADMVDAANLTNGSYARTLGYTTLNDGGGALYKIRTITNDDVVDGINIIAMNDADNTLVAELIKEPVPHVYDTVADMQAATSLVVGDSARTLGYYSLGDGGGGLYRVIETTGIDLSNTKYVSLDNDLAAELIITGEANVKQFGAKGDAEHDDTQAFYYSVRSADSIYIPTGRYILTDTISFDNKNIRGSNYTHVTIFGKITDPDKPILAVGGNSVVEGITVAYHEDYRTNNTAEGKRVGFLLNGGIGRDIALQQGTIRNCQASYCGTGFYSARNVFSCVFDTLKINNSYFRGFSLTGTARTGNVYTNIYINNMGFVVKNNTDSVAINQGFCLIGEESECTINQLNVEHLTAHQAVYLANIKGLSVGAIHIEGTMSRSAYQGFVHIDNCFGRIDVLSFYYTRHINNQRLIKLGNPYQTLGDHDIAGGLKGLIIGTLVCKGLNRPDRATYGYEPAYPIANSTISSSSLTTGFSFIDREAATGTYLLAIENYNWLTYDYEYNDSSVYESFPSNNHGNIQYQRLGSQVCRGATSARPTLARVVGLQYFDTTLNKLIVWNGSAWKDGSGASV